MNGGDLIQNKKVIWDLLLDPLGDFQLFKSASNKMACL